MKKVDYSKWETKIKEWEELLKDENLGKDDRWLMSSLSKLCSMAVECDQNYIPKEEGYIKCSRVIRLRKPVPKYVFSVLNVEKVLCSGLYVKAEGLLITDDYIESNYMERKNTLSNKLGEDFPEYRLSTIKKLSNGCYFILKRGGISEHLDWGSHYSMFELSDK